MALGGGLMSLVGMGVATGILAALVVSLRLLRLVVPKPSRPVLVLPTAGEQRCRVLKLMSKPTHHGTTRPRRG